MSTLQPDLIVAELPTHRAGAISAMLEQHVAGQLVAGRPRRLMPGATATAAVLMLAACASVVAGDRATAPVTNTARARCYTSASSASAGGYGLLGTTVSLTKPDGTPAQVTDALDVCTVLWRQGLLTLGQARLGPRIGRNHPVPPLVVCVMPNGTAAVFPGRPRTCAKLGLPRAGPGLHLKSTSAS
jgi:hypothetical protein